MADVVRVHPRLWAGSLKEATVLVQRDWLVKNILGGEAIVAVSGELLGPEETRRVFLQYHRTRNNGDKVEFRCIASNSMKDLIHDLQGLKILLEASLFVPVMGNKRVSQVFRKVGECHVMRDELISTLEASATTRAELALVGTVPTGGLGVSALGAPSASTSTLPQQPPDIEVHCRCGGAFHGCASGLRLGMSFTDLLSPVEVDDQKWIVMQVQGGTCNLLGSQKNSGCYV
eukprot:gene29247-12493_t